MRPSKSARQSTRRYGSMPRLPVSAGPTRSQAQGSSSNSCGRAGIPLKTSQECLPRLTRPADGSRRSASARSVNAAAPRQKRNRPTTGSRGPRRTHTIERSMRRHGDSAVIMSPVCTASANDPTRCGGRG